MLKSHNYDFTFMHILKSSSIVWAIPFSVSKNILFVLRVDAVIGINSVIYNIINSLFFTLS